MTIEKVAFIQNHMKDHKELEDCLSLEDISYSNHRDGAEEEEEIWVEGLNEEIINSLVDINILVESEKNKLIEEGVSIIIFF